VHLESKAPKSIENREFVQYRNYVCNPELVKKYGLYEKGNKYYVMFTKRVEHVKVTERKGIVRTLGEIS